MTAKRNCHNCDHGIGRDDVVYCTKYDTVYHESRAEICDDYRTRPESKYFDPERLERKTFTITFQEKTPRCGRCGHKMLTKGCMITFVFGKTSNSPYTTRTLCVACVEELMDELHITEDELEDD